MADKEATVYIVDVGATMADCRNGRIESDLDWAMRYVWDKICATVAASRKTWTVGVLGLRTDETRNAQQDEAGYDNIAVLQEVQPMTLTALRTLRGRIRPSSTDSGDAVSAIVVATDMLSKAAPKRLKFTRKIVLVTDGLGPIDGDDFDDLAYQLNDLQIQLVVIGVDFDDAEYGFKEEDKSQLKTLNEKLLRSLVEKCSNGVFGTMAEAIGELDRPNIKPYRPYKTYDGLLTLGNPAQYESALAINVERYFLTKVARAPPATTVVLKSESDLETQSTHTLDATGGLAFGKVQNARTYVVSDPSAPGGKREVAFEDLERGYEYGQTVVPLSETDRNVTELETTKGLSIVGFISRNNYEPFLNMGESCIMLPRKMSEPDELAFSTLVHAMVETETYAVARFVSKDKKEPQLLLLLPTATPDLLCIYDVPLPFAEDMRTYPFPPLDKVVTATGAVLDKHRLLPDDDLNEAMSDYVDAMDLSMAGTDEEGRPAEYAELADNYSPLIYRINKALTFRAVHPSEPFALSDSKFVTRFDHPPETLVQQSQPQIEALIRAAAVKKVPPKAKGRQSAANKPLSGLDVDALLGAPSAKSGKPFRISKDNAVPEFKQALAGTADVQQIRELTRQMADVVRSLIASSTGDLHYARAAENMRVMRDELIALEEPAMYNAFVAELKSSLAADELGGPRLEMWWAIRTLGLGLVTKAESEESDVTEEAAREFIRYFRA